MADLESTVQALAYLQYTDGMKGDIVSKLRDCAKSRLHLYANKFEPDAWELKCVGATEITDHSPPATTEVDER